MKNTKYLCISLPWAKERRRAILSQAEKTGIDVEFVEAIAGKDLPAEVPEYDRKKRFVTFNYDLMPNEIACVLSHRKAMREFLESGAEYGVIMEDDAVFAENIAAAVQEVTERLTGWEIAKLNTDDNSKLYPIGDEGRHTGPKGRTRLRRAWSYSCPY